MSDTEKTSGHPSDDQAGDEFGSYIEFLGGLSNENAIAQRFISAAHLLARAVTVSTVFNLIRSMGFNWETAASMTGDMLGMSRSTVARSVRDVERVVAFWNANGYAMVDMDAISEQISELTKKRLTEALHDQAEDKASENTSSS